MPERPKPGQLEERSEPLAVDGQKIRGRIPYGSESRDLGGWTEIIEPGALDSTRLDDLVATIDHVGVPIGRHPGTLQLEDRSDGMHWAVDPPQSRQDVREAVARGDLRAGSWRMRVGRDRWDGDVRHVLEIAELRDVAVVTDPAYPSAAVELRNHDPAKPEEGAMPEDNTPADQAENNEDTKSTEVRAEVERLWRELQAEQAEPDATRAAGRLHVEDRASAPPPRGLAEEFRAAGFPGERAEISFDQFRGAGHELRSATFTGAIATLNPTSAPSVDLGFDQRYAYPAFSTVAVDGGATSVNILSQKSRTLTAASNVVRAIDATGAKPEVATELELLPVALSQVAAVETGIPNILLEQPAFNSTVENDLRLQLNEGLDLLVLTEVAKSGFQAPTTDPLLVSIRAAMTTIMASGYNPDTLVLTPANAEALDTLLATAVTGEQFYVFQPAQVAPRNIYGLSVRISKTAPAPFVVDATAFGKLYVSPISLAVFEESAGSTNTSTVRLEGHAAFGCERQAAAVRIAAA